MILALDIATIRTGWCAGTGEALPLAGAWIFPHCGDDLGALGVTYEDHLSAALDRFCPELVVFESPIMVAPRDRLIVVRKLYGLAFETERLCKRRGVDCREAGLRRIKKELAGFAGAGKDDMVAAAEKLGVILPATKAAGREDAADATGAWLLGLRHLDPKASARFDQKLYAHRGALL